MIDDFLGVASWPTAIVAVVCFLIWGFNVHEDRQNYQQLRLAVVHECAHVDYPEDCAKQVQLALKAVK